MSRDYRYHKPLPPPALLNISTVEWAVLVRLSDTCQINYAGTTKVGAYTLSADLNLPLTAVWSALRKLHEMRYVAISDDEGNQCVDHVVIAAVEFDRIRAQAAVTKEQGRFPLNIKSVSVAPKPQPKPKQPPAPTSVPVKTRTETELSGYGMM